MPRLVQIDPFSSCKWINTQTYIPTISTLEKKTLSDKNKGCFTEWIIFDVKLQYFTSNGRFVIPPYPYVISLDNFRKIRRFFIKLYTNMTQMEAVAHLCFRFPHRKQYQHGGNMNFRGGNVSIVTQNNVLNFFYCNFC
jgi:hypothetical protein